MSDYYLTRQTELISQFDADAARWRQVMAERESADFVGAILEQSRRRFEALIPSLPYIGGDESWTEALLEAARCLAFYQAMQVAGRMAAEVGEILYTAALHRQPEPIPASQPLDDVQLMARRRQRAKRTQLRRYPDDYICEFVPGDGQQFDYGYDFLECAAQKFYHLQGAEELLPFYCRLDFARSQVYGLGLIRTTTLAEGGEKCDFRFKPKQSDTANASS
jgi:hypothetical protein